MPYNTMNTTEQIKQIADRIKNLREVSGVSAELLAEEMNIPETQLLEYENGNSDIPVGFLHRLAQRYAIPLSSILSGEDPRLRIYSVVRKGKGLNTKRRQQYRYESLAYNFIDKRGEPFMVRIDPQADDVAPEFNSHPGQEFDYVIEGKVKIIVDNHEIILNEGDSIYYDSGYMHAMRALNGRKVKMLAIIL